MRSPVSSRGPDKISGTAMSGRSGASMEAANRSPLVPKW